MSERTKRLFGWNSLIFLLLSIFGLFYTSTQEYSNHIDNYQIGLFIIMLISGLNLLWLFSQKNQHKEKIRSLFKLLTYILLVLILIQSFTWKFIHSDLVNLPFLLLILILIFFAIIHIFIFSKVEEIKGVVMIIFYLIISLAVKHLNQGNSLTHMFFSFLLLGCGMYVFGLRNYFTIDKNRYLKVLSLISCIVILFGSFGVMTVSTNYIGMVLICYSVSAFLITLIVLLSLPVSGYTQWSSTHKLILRKIAIPWIFLLLIVSIRLVFPGLTNSFFSEKPTQSQEFFMYDYKLTNKNGLEPDVLK